MESAFDLRRRHWLWGQWSGRESSGIRPHGLLVAEWLAVSDARRRRSADLAVRRHWRQPDGGRIVFGNRNRFVSTRTHWQRLVRYHIAAGRRRLVRQRRDSSRACRSEILAATRSQKSGERSHERLQEFR